MGSQLVTAKHFRADNSQSLLKLMSIQLVMSSNHLILCRPLLLPSVFLSIRVFSNESALRIRWPKYWSFSFSFSPSNEYSGLISFRMDWFDLLDVQGTPHPPNTGTSISGLQDNALSQENPEEDPPGPALHAYHLSPNPASRLSDHARRHQPLPGFGFDGPF